MFDAITNISTTTFAECMVIVIVVAAIIIWAWYAVHGDNINWD